MKGRKKFSLWMGRVLFFFYLMGLCYFLFFAENYGRVLGEGTYRYNLVPFREIERFWTYRRILGIHSFYNLVGNVVGFIPAGFFIPILWEKKKGFFFTFWVTFQMSFFVELTQLLLKVGSFDVDDLILNTLGGVLGYLILVITGLGRKHEKKK